MKTNLDSEIDLDFKQLTFVFWNIVVYEISRGVNFLIDGHTFSVHWLKNEHEKFRFDDFKLFFLIFELKTHTMSLSCSCSCSSCNNFVWRTASTEALKCIEE